MKLKRTVLAALVAGALWAQTADDLFQQALMKERSQGDLSGAIKLYERIVKEHSADRKLAARALLQIAQCQERQGGENARRTYERLVKEYSDQTQAVTEARARIAALSTGGVISTAPRVRQLWTGAEVSTEGSVSPDGRWLTYPNWWTGDLAVRDLHTGVNRNLTNVNGISKPNVEFAQDSVFSPDGKMIAYNWWVDDTDTYEIRVMNADGSGVRTVAFKGMKGYNVPKAWFPDGRSMVVTRYNNASFSHHVVNVSTGETREILAPVKKSGWGVSVSPDGRWIAFDMGETDTQRDIYIMPAQGGEPAAVITHPDGDEAPVWSNDGKSIHFLSNRSGSFGLYRIPVENGRTAGTALLVKGDLGASIRPIGITRDGALHYGLRTSGPDVYQADYDAASGKVGKPTLAVETSPGRNFSPVYSPDGTMLAWVTSGAAGGNNIVAVRNLNTGTERRYESAHRVLSTIWSPDSGKILFSSLSRNPDATSLYLLDVARGGFSDLYSFTQSRGWLIPVFSPDGSKVYVVYRPFPMDEWQVQALDVQSRQPTVLCTLAGSVNEGRLHGLAISPDGSHLVFVQRSDRGNSKLMVLPTTGGQPRVIAEFNSDDDMQNRGVSFEPEGKHVVVRQGKPNDPKRTYRPTALLRVELATGKVTPLDFEGDWVQSPHVHPSGRKIAFQAGSPTTEIWVAENILPPVTR